MRAARGQGAWYIPDTMRMIRSFAVLSLVAIGFSACAATGTAAGGDNRGSENAGGSGGSPAVDAASGGSSTGDVDGGNTTVESTLINEWVADGEELKRICEPGYYYGRFFCRFRSNKTCQENDGEGTIEFTGPIVLEFENTGGNGEIISVADGSLLSGKALQVLNRSQNFNGPVTGDLECQSGEFTGAIDGEYFGDGGSTAGELAGDLFGDYNVAGELPIVGGNVCFAMSNPGDTLASGNLAGTCKGSWDVTLCADETKRDGQPCTVPADCCSELCEEVGEDADGGAPLMECVPPRRGD